MATGVNSEHTGGFMSLFTDQGQATSSGSLVVRTANAGTNGISGALTFSSGITSSASSGELRWNFTAVKGKGGSISITVGTGTTVAGGVLTLRSGASTTTAAAELGTCL